jgi:hypothetical protein
LVWTHTRQFTYENESTHKRTLPPCTQV